MSSLLWLYVVVPNALKGSFEAPEKATVAATILAVTQLPLDWDLEVPWQVYPYPIIFATEIGHTLGLLFKLLTS